MSHARILKDLTALKNNPAALKALFAEVGISTAATKEPGVAVIDYIPKKGKHAGKTVKRLQITGDFFPVLMGQEACKVLVEHGLAALKGFADKGK